MSVLALIETVQSPWVPVVGYLAGTLTTISFLPQVMKVLRCKSADDLSLGMLVAFCSGVVLWLIYGAILWSWPIIVTNFATLLLAGAVLVLKLRYDGVKRSTQRSAISTQP